jgi:small subunit ribosomal protein S1
MRARVVRLMDKGVVVDLGNDLEGFVPMSQLGTEQVVENPADVVKEGQPLEVQVLEVDPIHHRIVVAVTGYPDEPFEAPPPRPIPPPDDEVME